jgi:hypothetical protein
MSATLELRRTPVGMVAICSGSVDAVMLTSRRFRAEYPA